MATSSRPAWRTSTFTDNGQSCVEVAPEAGAVRVRDTKDRGAGPELVLPHDAFAALCTAAVERRSATEPLVVRAERTTRHAGRAVVTHWHVGSDADALHYTDAEWRAFAAGVRAGEFAFAPV